MPLPQDAMILAISICVGLATAGLVWFGADAVSAFREYLAQLPKRAPQAAAGEAGFDEDDGLAQ